jgi:hypothetical protein
MLGAIREKHNFKYFENLTVKVCNIWCNDVYMYILYCDILWWKLTTQLYCQIPSKVVFQLYSFDSVYSFVVFGKDIIVGGKLFAIGD